MAPAFRLKQEGQPGVWLSLFAVPSAHWSTAIHPKGLVLGCFECFIDTRIHLLQMWYVQWYGERYREQFQVVTCKSLRNMEVQIQNNILRCQRAGCDPAREKATYTTSSSWSAMIYLCFRLWTCVNSTLEGIWATCLALYCSMGCTLSN